jgi:enamine deaminase RidA (YjgF/YER057c/UK114 family)
MERKNFARAPGRRSAGLTVKCLVIFGATSMVEVRALIDPAMLVEIEAEAVITATD